MSANPDEPFGLPPGSIRAGLTVILVLGAFGLIAFHRITIEGFLAITAGPLGFFFGSFATPPGKAAGGVPAIGNVSGPVTVQAPAAGAPPPSPPAPAPPSGGITGG